MKQIGFIIFLIGMTLFVNFNVKHMTSAIELMSFTSDKDIYSNEYFLFIGENKFYYSADEGYTGELFVLNREQTEHLLTTNKIDYIEKFEVKDEGMIKFNAEKTGFYTLVLKNNSGKDSDFQFSTAYAERNVKDCTRRSLYIAVFGIFIMITGVVKNRMKKQYEKK
ncbi:MAG TPA: hypothetical protein ENG20_00990 [Methanomicrobia archaeon]|nr:hypothetical protein [Methanomicrobia archaeon]